MNIPNSFKNARGVIPWKEGDELPEDAIRRQRNGLSIEQAWFWSKGWKILKKKTKGLIVFDSMEELIQILRDEETYNENLVEFIIDNQHNITHYYFNCSYY